MEFAILATRLGGSLHFVEISDRDMQASSMNDPSTTDKSESASRTVLSIAILAAGVAGFFLMGTPRVETQAPRGAQAVVVETSPAMEHTDGIEFVVDGVVVPFKRIAIAAEVGGRVQFKSPQCRTGKNVRKGEVLIRVDPADYELEVKRLDEELTQAGAMLDELQTEVNTIDNQIESAKKQAELDDRQLQRTNELFDRRAASETELDTARRTALASRSNLQTLQDQKNQIDQRRIRLKSAQTLGETNLEKANLSLSRCEIRSPIDGIIVSESVEQDGFVQTGNAVIVLQDSSQLDVTCQLHMRQMNWLWQSTGDAIQSNLDTNAFPRAPAEVLYDLGGKTFAWKGEVDRFDGAGIDDQTRMVPCRVHVDDPTSARLDEHTKAGAKASAGPTKPPALMTGMFVKVRVKTIPPVPLIRLPQRALQPGNAVWVFSDSKLVRKTIQVATSNATDVIAFEEESGIQAGDQIVVSPLAAPVDGMDGILLADFETQNKKTGPKSAPGPTPRTDKKNPSTDPSEPQGTEVGRPTANQGGAS